MADVRTPAKPNQLSSQADFGTLQSGGNGWDTKAPESDHDAGGYNQDPYSPQMLGGAPGADHNSESVNATSID